MTDSFDCKIYNVENGFFMNHPVDTSEKNYLLDFSNKNSFTNIENFVYQVSIFHFKERNLEFDENKYNIEFSIENECDKFKNDYNKTNKSHPLFSIVTFMDNECNPMIVTNIDMDCYKYKEIQDENTFICFKPTKNSQIVFDSSKYYGFYKMNENKCNFFKINIWENCENFENDIPKYSSNQPCELYEIAISLLEMDVPSETIIYKNMINLFLYEDYEKIESFDNIINKYSENSKIIFNNIVKDFIDITFLQDKYPDIADELYPFINKNTEISFDCHTNRFCKNKIIQNMLSKDVCYWIINECENFQWEESKYVNYPTYLSIEKMPAILNFLLFVSNFWLVEIKKLYNCENINLNINDLFVSKYTKESISEVMNPDGSFLSLNIYLNSNVDYMNGEICFNDNDQKIMIQQGDVLIYNGKKLRTKGCVNDGAKYVLVFMLDIIL